MGKIELKNITTKIGSGATPRGGQYSYQDKGISLIRSQNVLDFVFSTNGLAHIDEQQATELENVTVNINDILLNITGDSIARVCMVPTYVLPARVNQHVAIIRCNDQVVPEYVMYYLLNLKPYLLKICGVGGTRNALTKDVLEKLLIENPEYQTQKNIASVLSSLDSKIELNNRINAELEAMAKTIYDYWFVQFDFPFDFAQGKPDADGLPYKSSGGKMVWNVELKRDVPDLKSWSLVSLGDIVNIFDSRRIPLSSIQREKMKGIYPYFGATSIMDYINDYIFDGEYILIAEDGSVMDEKGFPIVQFIWGKTWVNNHAHVLQPKDLSNNEYLFHLLKSISVIQIMTGSIQKKINQENLMKVKVLFPSEEILKAFSDFAEPIRRKLINIYEENQKLSHLRDWLLPMLMNGQVRVG